MFKEFRAMYPHGSLNSELLQGESPYIVKCSVCVGGWLLSTGLGSGPTVEEAENKARLRALESLNGDAISPASMGLTPPPHQEIRPQNDHQDVVNVPPSSSPSPPAASPTSSVLNEVQSHGSEQDQSITPPAGNPTIEEKSDVFTPLVPELEEAPPDNPMEDLFDMANELDPPEENMVPSPPPPAPSTPAEIDFNDVIARTNVELKRLSWTNEQGRNYLLQTYGKRSRHLLSDEELLEFLQYLQNQP